MQEIILIVGGIAYAIFIIQFILSLFGFDSDFDIDIDLDGEADFSFSDLVSFKGLIHFIMGVATYLESQLYFGEPVTTITWIIASIVGLIFVIGLYYIYRSCKKLQFIPKREEGVLEERYVKILRHESELTYVGSTIINGAYDMFTVEASEPLEIGKEYKITKFINNKIYI